LGIPKGLHPLYKKLPNYLIGDKNPMTNLHDVVLQITDKNIKNEIKVKTCDTVYETHIAKELNVYVHTVLRVVNKTADSLRINPLNELPQQMCWDKFISVASAKASMSFS
jgi:hypothetical protein